MKTKLLFIFMNTKLRVILGIFFYSIFTASAYALKLEATSIEDKKVAQAATSSGGIMDTIWSVISTIFMLMILFVILTVIGKLIRLCYEVYRSKDLVYMRVMLPRADSKLDKEQDTKKDFKEKIGIMTLFFKSAHMIGQISALNTIMNFFFNHAKVSLEMVYKDGLVYFYVSTYKEHMTLIRQQITSNYPDAEIRLLDAKDVPEIKPYGYTLEAASVGKQADDIYPIKTYKYFEDDPLSSYTNNFGSLKKTDVACIQWVAKPLGASWNRRAKDAARLVAKGEYKK